jgi:hypothetical protein
MFLCTTGHSRRKLVRQRSARFRQALKVMMFRGVCSCTTSSLSAKLSLLRRVEGDDIADASSAAVRTRCLPILRMHLALHSELGCCRVFVHGQAPKVIMLRVRLPVHCELVVCRVRVHQYVLNITMFRGTFNCSTSSLCVRLSLLRYVYRDDVADVSSAAV